MLKHFGAKSQENNYFLHESSMWPLKINYQHMKCDIS
jgi:hypothetical protein